MRSIAMFFPDFDRAGLGRKPLSASSKLARQTRQLDACCLAELDVLLGHALPSWLRVFKSSSGANSRKRMFTVAVTFWTFLLQVLDDATTIQVVAGAITWSVLEGPLAGISANGVATAGNVYQNTAATVQGIHAGLIGTLGLTVLDSIADNYGAYAADGLGDDWQVQFFGLNNANAAPLLDPDFDGQTNLFEFTAGLVPIDPNSNFRLTIQPVPGQPGQKQVVFSPRWADRSYSILTSATLQGSPWTPLTGGAVSDDGTQRTITDPNASGERKFYKVEIVKP